jgi:hypothetical protein
MWALRRGRVIHGWALFCNGLWVVGLAVSLAALSLATYRACSEGGGAFRAWCSVLALPSYRRVLVGAAALVMVGVLLSVWLA